MDTIKELFMAIMKNPASVSYLNAKKIQQPGYQYFTLSNSTSLFWSRLKNWTRRLAELDQNSQEVSPMIDKQGEGSKWS